MNFYPSDLKTRTKNSSNIHTLYYNSQNKTMAVRFNNDSMYEYQNVDVQVFQELSSSESVGASFNQVKHKFQYSNVSGMYQLEKDEDFAVTPEKAVEENKLDTLQKENTKLKLENDALKLRLERIREIAG